MARLKIDDTLNRELERKVAESGLRKGFIADKLNIEVNTLRRKLKGERSWTEEEVEIITEMLNMK